MRGRIVDRLSRLFRCGGNVTSLVYAMDDIIFTDLMQSNAFVSVVSHLSAKSIMYNIAARIVQSHFFRREYCLSTAIALRAARSFHAGPAIMTERKRART
jgi:hypothetical protein